MNGRLVSVIVCTYNRAESLRETIAALQRQASPTGVGVELVVVDNNSSDRTPQVVEQCGREGSRPLRYVFEPTQGLSHARNRGVQEARGELIAFTDDDVIPDPGWVAALWQATERFSADAVGGRILPLWAKQPPAWLAGQQLVLESLAILDGGPEPVMDGIHTAYRIYGANMAFRKSVFSQIGAFRTDLGVVGAKQMRGDETEMLVRAHRAGKRLVYAPQAVVHHKVPAERMRLSYFRRVKFYEGRSAVLRGELAPKPFPRWLVRECGEHLLRSLWAYGTGRLARGVQQEMTFWEQTGQLVELVTSSRANGASHA